MSGKQIKLVEEEVNSLQAFVEEKIEILNTTKDDLFVLQDRLGKLKKMMLSCVIKTQPESILPPIIDSSTIPEYISPVALPTAMNGTALDPNTGVTIRRLITGVRHEYSERSAVNLDCTRYLSLSSRVYDSTTLVETHNLDALAGMSSEIVFSSTKADVVFGAASLQFAAYNLVTGQTYNTTIPAFGFGPFETSPSENDRILATDTQAPGIMRLIDASDLNNITEIASAPEPSNRDAGHISPNGQYVVVSYPGGSNVYDSNLNFQRTLPQGGHGATAKGENGEQLYVSTASDARIYVYDLSDNSGASDYVLGFTNVQSASHLSGNAFAVPGWIFGSWNADFGNADGDNTAGFIGALKLEPNSTKFRVWSSYFFQDHVYENTPKAAVSFDGKKIVFTTPVGGGGATDYILSI